MSYLFYDQLWRKRNTKKFQCKENVYEKYPLSILSTATISEISMSQKLRLIKKKIRNLGIVLILEKSTCFHFLQKLGAVGEKPGRWGRHAGILSPVLNYMVQSSTHLPRGDVGSSLKKMLNTHLSETILGYWGVEMENGTDPLLRLLPVRNGPVSASCMYSLPLIKGTLHSRQSHPHRGRCGPCPH